jgi:hypothetical protein
MNLNKLLTAAAVAAISLAVSAASLTPAHAGTDGAPTVARKKYGVTATANRTEVLQDGRVVVTGTVAPAARGARVVLEVKYDGAGWKRTTITDKLDDEGDFRLVDTVDSGRSRSYRVLKPARGKVGAGRSTTLPVVVYSWRDLSAQTYAHSESTGTGQPVKMNGVLYPDSLSAYNTSRGAIDYNLERKCRQLETTAGIADLSESGATGTVRLDADGTDRFTGSYALTQTAPVSLSLIGVFRLTFAWTSTNTAGTPEDQTGAYPALGSPRILCRD